MAGKHWKRFFIGLICGVGVLTLAPIDAQASPGRNPIVLDTNGNVRSFYGVPVTLTRSGLKRLPYRVKKGHYYAEGDRYTNYKLTAQDGVEVVVTFNEDGSLFSASTKTPTATGPKGSRIGSTLADLKAAWPDGDFTFYFEHGYVVTYRTRSNVSFMFDPKDMPPGAFDHDRPTDFPVPDTIKVETIAVFPEPSPPAPRAPGPLDKNKTSIETYRIENDKQIPISKLDIERRAEPSSLGLVWHNMDQPAIERTVDLSGYPDVDIYASDLIHAPEPLVVSFRYGNFKNCEVREDDRDKVYIKLDSSGATTSSRLPEGIEASARWPTLKYAGPAIGSVAHGCRRTFDPKTGKSGLESAGE